MHVSPFMRIFRWPLISLAMLALSTSAVFAHGIHNKAPWAACEAQERGASCAYTDGHDDLYRGSCQLISNALLCVRNQPIVRQEGHASHPAEPSPAAAGK